MSVSGSMGNVVIIMADQQSASALPMYGNPIVRAPNLTGLAEEGCLFTAAFTSCPLCVPARVSLFTGQYPSAHGSLDNTIPMAPGRRHLLGILKQAGYRTGLTGKLGGQPLWPGLPGHALDHRSGHRLHPSRPRGPVLPLVLHR